MTADERTTEVEEAGTAADARVDLKGLLPEELLAFVEGLGEKPFRARQLQAWMYSRGISDWSAMTDLSQQLRDRLATVATISALEQVACQESTSGGAAKFLFALPTGERLESVLIADRDRRTACLSSQVGCPLGCRFCATGRMGFVRNLSAAQIVDQLLQIGRYAGKGGERVTNVVMMGMGEPLLNYDAVVRAVRIMRLELGPGVGGRKITVSSAGHVPGILRLARDDVNVGLAVSLNATTDEVRNRLMPINRKYPIADVLAAAREFHEVGGRRVTFEFVMLAGITDTDDEAVRLADLTRGVPCKINLIPYNEIDERGEYRRPAADRVARFRQLLEQRSPMPVTMRESRGRDIAAACGQLHQLHPGRPGSRSDRGATPA